MKSFIELLKSGKKIKLNTIQFNNIENKEKLKDLEKQLKTIEKEYTVDWEYLEKIKFKIK
jgi:hypothetical protein